MVYDVVTKRQEALICTATCVNLGNTPRDQSQKATCSVILLMWNVQHKGTYRT